MSAATRESRPLTSIRERDTGGELVPTWRHVWVYDEAPIHEVCGPALAYTTQHKTGKCTSYGNKELRKMATDLLYQMVENKSADTLTILKLGSNFLG
jgi:hypothetical protein